MYVCGFCCDFNYKKGDEPPANDDKSAILMLLGFVTLWLFCTTYSLLKPKLSENWEMFSAKQMVYISLIVIDWCVGISLVWFLCFIHC